jgi:hypothetical protein
MNKDTAKTERQAYHITPFTYEDRAVRTVQIDDSPWFVAKDVCEALGIQNHKDAVARQIPESEKGVVSTDTPGGKQEMLMVNEPGLYRLIFQSRKPEAEQFKTWVFAEVLPRIRRGEGVCAAPDAYSLFSGCGDMTIKRVNKLLYYLALTPPLSNADISRLLEVSGGTVTFWRKRLPAGAAREAVARLGIDMTGHSANVPPRSRPPSLPGSAAKEAAPPGEAAHVQA